MEKIDLKNITKVEIKHTYYNYSDTIVCNIDNYIKVINNLCKKGVEIIEINFYK